MTKQIFKLVPAIALSTLTLISKAAEKPNIIFLLSDDHRWNALGCMGNNIIKTPTIDSLASKGTLFTNAYVSTSICCSSRASILSGQYTSRHGIIDFIKEMTPEAVDQTYPQILKNKAGYTVGFIGKYGIGLPNQPKEKYDYWTCEKKHQPNYEMTDENGKFIHHTDEINREIKGFFNQYNGDKPFCLSVSFKAPHSEDGDLRQFIVAERFKNLYANDIIPVPATNNEKYWMQFPDWFRTKNEARNRYFLRFDTPDKYQEMTKKYYQLLTHLDQVVGDLMTTLKAKNLDKNTVIIFMGDNGFFFGEHGLAGKWFAYNESVRVPLIIFDPRVQSKKVVSKMALNVDIAPTILDLAGIQVPETMQGKSLMPLVKGDKVPWRHDFFYEHNFPEPTLPTSEALIGERYKYIIYNQHNYEELFDMKHDVFEVQNLASNKKYAKILEQQRARFSELKSSVR